MSISELTNTAEKYLHAIQSANPSTAAGQPTVGAASLQTLFTQVQNDIQLNSKDFKALNAAIKAGDLPAASTAFAAVLQDFQNIPTVAGVQSPLDASTPMGKDFKALGDALKTGDLAAAQAALKAFQQDMGGVPALQNLYQDGVAFANAFGVTSGGSSAAA
jgi:Skp family chaperone for outer membrane proteins